ncbi:MAG: SH3 domain-containing protein [Usitatibacter sp.]
MRSRLAMLLLALLAALPVIGQEAAFTNRATELKERAAADARTVANLSEGAPVKVLERGGGGWTRIDAGGQQGWIRVFHLRFAAVAQASPDSGGGVLGNVTSALGFGRDRSKGATVATTGIRGLSPEDLKNASPDNAALAKMQSYRADKGSAERFARDGKLAEVSVDLPEARR